MPWIPIVSLGEATGLVKKQYDAALRRAGRLWGIVSLMSPNGVVLKAAMALYLAVMHRRSPLSRGQREMLAVVVSARNHCLY